MAFRQVAGVLTHVLGGDNRDRVKLIQKTGAVTLGFVHDRFVENFVLNSTNDEIQDTSGYGLLAIGDLGGWKTGIIGYYVSNKATAGMMHRNSALERGFMMKRFPSVAGI